MPHALAQTLPTPPECRRLPALAARQAIGPAPCPRPRQHTAYRFEVDGARLEVVVGADPQLGEVATGPLTIVLATPPGVVARFCGADDPFGRGCAVGLVTDPALSARGDAPAPRVAVQIPALRELPLTVAGAPLDAAGRPIKRLGSAIGRANAYVTVES